jgi:hypothetical protein
MAQVFAVSPGFSVNPGLATNPGGPAAAEMQLLEAAQRAGRLGPAQNAGRVALVLHLSALRPPAPRPHHRRIARAILQDAALRHDGQVFVLRNGDLALLARDAGLYEAAPREAGRTGPLPPAGPAGWPGRGGGSLALADALARLLRVDTADPEQLVSIWPLDRAHHRLIDYAACRVAERLAEPLPSDEEPTTPPAVVDEIGALVGNARIHDLMQRQTAIVLLAPETSTSVAAAGAAAAGAGAAAEAAGGKLRPLYREVTFSIAALEARIAAGGQASADPFLFRHLAGQLDRRMLDVIREELGGGGPLDIAIGARGAPPLHLNLTLGAILSPSFAAFAAACRAAGATAGVEISLIEACADTVAFTAARAAVAQAGMALALDGVSHLALLLAAPWLLEPDLLKLDWSPRVADLPAADAADLAASLTAVGVHRVVLQRAETEAALRWGLAHGIRRFQGRHVDAMLGAARIMGCAMSSGCTLRQCIERAGAISPAARAGCGNPGLLDAAIPTRPANAHAHAHTALAPSGAEHVPTQRAAPRLIPARPMLTRPMLARPMAARTGPGIAGAHRPRGPANS